MTTDDDANLAPTPEPPTSPPPPTTTTPAPPRPPRVWTTFAVFFGAQGLQSVIALPVVIAVFARIDFKQAFDYDAIKAQMADPDLMVPSLFLAALANLLVVGAATWASAQPWRERLSLPSLRASPLDVVLLLVASLGIGELATAVAKSLGGYDGSVLHSFEQSTASASSMMLLALTCAGVFAAIVEELLFRGSIQTRMTLRWGPRVAVVATAAMFGVMHGDLVQGTFAFCFGAVVGLVAYKRASIMPGLYAHVVNNVIAFLSPTLISDRLADGSAAGGSLTLGLVGAAMFVAGTAALVFRLRNVSPSAPPPSPSLSSTQLLQPGAPSGSRVGAVYGGAGCLIAVAVVVACVLVTMSVAKGMAETPPPPSTTTAPTPSPSPPTPAPPVAPVTPVTPATTPASGP